MGIKIMRIVICIVVALLTGLITQAQQLETYDVKKGETLSSIAKQFEVTTNQILEYNPDLSNQANLKPQTIFIPVINPSENSYDKYQIAEGETLWSISQSYGLSVQDLKNANPKLDENDLKKGQYIKIPVRKLSTKSSKSVNQSVTNSQFNTLKHLVLPKETKYGIAKQYGIEVKDLEKANPSVKTLQPGQILNIIRKPDNQEEKITAYLDYKYYKVPEKETIYSLSKQYDISRKKLETLNPALKNLGLQKGMVLKLPKAKNTDEVLNLFAGKQLDLKTKINNYSRKYIDVFLPLNLHKFHKDSIDKQKKLADHNLSQISIDFYNGVKAAIDSVNALGLEVDFRLYDTQTRPYHLKNLIQKIDFSQTQAVIGPIIPPNYQMMTKRLKRLNIPVISPFSIAEKSSKNTVSTVPDQVTKQKALISMMESIHESENILVITDSTDYQTQYRFKYTFPKSKIISVRNNYVKQNAILKHLNNKKENWVVLTSDDIGIVESTVNHLHSLAEYEIKRRNNKGEYELVNKKHYPIRLFSSNRKNFYEDEIDNAYLSEMHFISVENSKQLAVDQPTSFMKAFYVKHGYYPNKYSVRGFDLTYDILIRLGIKSNLHQSLAIPGMTDYNLNRFYYTENAFFKNGYQNSAYFLIEYKDGLKTANINSLKNREKLKLDIPDLKKTKN